MRYLPTSTGEFTGFQPSTGDFKELGKVIWFHGKVIMLAGLIIWSVFKVLVNMIALGKLVGKSREVFRMIVIVRVWPSPSGSGKWRFSLRSPNLNMQESWWLESWQGAKHLSDSYDNFTETFRKTHGALATFILPDLRVVSKPNVLAKLTERLFQSWVLGGSSQDL